MPCKMQFAGREENNWRFEATWEIGPTSGLSFEGGGRQGHK